MQCLEMNLGTIGQGIPPDIKWHRYSHRPMLAICYDSAWTNQWRNRINGWSRHELDVGLGQSLACTDSH
jgi:hypothetical protein